MYLLILITETFYEALYDYQAQNHDELTFATGDVIRVLEYNDDGWWCGELRGGQIGLLPSNYVQLLENQHAHIAEV